MTLIGSCLCGGIRYEIIGPLGPASQLPLLDVPQGNRCRIPDPRQRARQGFRMDKRLRTADALQVFEGQERSFCRVCGSTLVTFYANDPGILKLALGTLDDDPGTRAECHVFVGSKAPWFEITDNLPQFDRWPNDAARFGIHDRKSSL